jgi:hypothetical protein
MSAAEAIIRRGYRVPSTPRISVVIPAYKSIWLDETLDSVRAQTFRDFEIIVVDDGSPEPICPPRRDDLVIVRQPNSGPGGARNRGVQVARGELVAIVDDDDRWLPAKLERQVAFHDAHPEFVMTCTDILMTDGETTWPGLTVQQRSGAAGPEIPFDRLFYENCITCSSVMMKRDEFLKTSGMKPHIRLGEDYGLWLRLAVLGPIGYLPEPLILRRQHPQSLMQQSMRDGSWVAQERGIYDEFLREHPEIVDEDVVRAAFARLEFQGAWAHLTRREWSDARRALQRSLAYNPLQPKAWFDFVRATLRVGPLRAATDGRPQRTGSSN